jgi:WD40 repeat protein
MTLILSIILQENGHEKLEYHKSRVRSVRWNYELPWLLISGGDDSCLAAWDIRHNKMIFEIMEPCISVSSMTNHPSNPFTLITSHLDNSVICWDLMGLNDIYLAQMKFILEMGLFDVTSDQHDLMSPALNGKLAGESSKILF